MCLCTLHSVKVQKLLVVVCTIRTLTLRSCFPLLLRLTTAFPIYQTFTPKQVDAPAWIKKIRKGGKPKSRGKGNYSDETEAERENEREREIFIFRSYGRLGD